jgi:paraquat-inducible protein B
MSEAPVQAIRRRHTSLSPVWIVPFVALLIGLWLVYDNIQRRGPLITLTIDDAEGLEAGNTQIRLHNVEVGRVESLTLTEDLSHILVSARMSPDAERMLAEDTVFWVVKPRIGREGISGLGTVLSGAYIELLPGSSDLSSRHFNIQSQPPPASSNTPGLRIRLLSELGSSLRVGDPVSYQGFTVGRIEEAVFEPASRQMRHVMFIESPYDTLITANTRFWKSSGIDLQLDTQGIRLGIDSLEALLMGGATFGYLDDDNSGDRVAQESLFSLFPNQESAMQAGFDQYLEYVLLIDNTVRGLAAGAPVEYRGVRVGTVAAVPWNFSVPDPGLTQPFAIPVLMRLEPQRFEDRPSDIGSDLTVWSNRFEALFEQGLRANLKTGNLLTGALYVDLGMHPELAGSHVASSFANHAVFPSTSSGLAQIEGQITALLDKLNALQVEPLLAQFEDSLVTARALLAELHELGASLRSLSEAPETRALPGNLQDTLADLRTTLAGLAPDSQAYSDLGNSLQGVERLLRELQPLLRTLDEQPNALLFNRRLGEDPQPRSAP